MSVVEKILYQFFGGLIVLYSGCVLLWYFFGTPGILMSLALFTFGMLLLRVPGIQSLKIILAKYHEDRRAALQQADIFIHHISEAPVPYHLRELYEEQIEENQDSALSSNAPKKKRKNLLLRKRRRLHRFLILECEITPTAIDGMVVEWDPLDMRFAELAFPDENGELPGEVEAAEVVGIEFIENGYFKVNSRSKVRGHAHVRYYLHLNSPRTTLMSMRYFFEVVAEPIAVPVEVREPSATIRKFYQEIAKELQQTAAIHGAPEKATQKRPLTIAEKLDSRLAAQIASSRATTKAEKLRHERPEQIALENPKIEALKAPEAIPTPKIAAPVKAPQPEQIAAKTLNKIPPVKESAKPLSAPDPDEKPVIQEKPVEKPAIQEITPNLAKQTPLPPVSEPIKSEPHTTPSAPAPKEVTKKVAIPVKPEPEAELPADIKKEATPIAPQKKSLPASQGREQANSTQVISPLEPETIKAKSQEKVALPKRARAEVVKEKVTRVIDQIKPVVSQAQKTVSHFTVVAKQKIREAEIPRKKNAFLRAYQNGVDNLERKAGEFSQKVKTTFLERFSSTDKIPNLSMSKVNPAINKAPRTSPAIPTAKKVTVKIDTLPAEKNVVSLEILSEANIIHPDPSKKKTVKEAVSPAPLEEFEVEFYIIRNDEKQEGPFAYEVVQGMFENGELRSEHLIWHAGLNGWTKIADIEEVVVEEV